MTYSELQYGSKDKPLVWLHGKLKTPPFSAEARLQAGFLIRCLQKNERLSMPYSRPMPSIGHHCHELRVNDGNLSWRIIYRIDPDTILILEVFDKKTNKTPKQIINTCKDRIRDYDDATK